MPTSLGPAEILVILVVALIVLGPKRLPDAGRQVGKALAEVRRWSQDMKYEMNQAFNEPPASPVGTSPTATEPVSSAEPPAVIEVTSAAPASDTPAVADVSTPDEPGPATTSSEAPPEARG